MNRLNARRKLKSRKRYVHLMYSKGQAKRLAKEIWQDFINGKGGFKTKVPKGGFVGLDEILKSCDKTDYQEWKH